MLLLDAVEGLVRALAVTISWGSWLALAASVSCVAVPSSDDEEEVTSPLPLATRCRTSLAMQVIPMPQRTATRSAMPTGLIFTTLGPLMKMKRRQMEMVTARKTGCRPPLC